MLSEIYRRALKTGRPGGPGGSPRAAAPGPRAARPGEQGRGAPLRVADLGPARDEVAHEALPAREPRFGELGDELCSGDDEIGRAGRLQAAAAALALRLKALSRSRWPRRARGARCGGSALGRRRLRGGGRGIACHFPSVLSFYDYSRTLFQETWQEAGHPVIVAAAAVIGLLVYAGAKA